MLTLGLIQTSVVEDSDKNIQKAVSRIKKAAKEGAQIVCLQELFKSPYFPQRDGMDADRFSESIPGDSTDLFSNLAKELEIVIIAPIFEKTQLGPRYYNSAVVVDADGAIMGVYRKTHIPYDLLYYEKSYFKEGDSGYQVFKTRFGTIAVLICYDQWFPEAARIVALEGADVIFYPTAIGWIEDSTSPIGSEKTADQDSDWHEAWQTIQRGHAIANGVHVAAVNRVGKEGKLRFWGGSFVCDAFGKVIKKAGIDKEETLVVSVDIRMNKRVREGWGFISNRRPETYRLLCKEKLPSRIK